MKIVGIVDGGFGPERLTLFVVLLDPGLFVVDMERGDDAVGDHTGVELAGRAAG